MVIINLFGTSFLFQRRRFWSALSFFLRLYPSGTLRQKFLMFFVSGKSLYKYLMPLSQNPFSLVDQRLLPHDFLVAYSTRQHSSDKYFGVTNYKGQAVFFKAGISSIGSKKLDYESFSIQKMPYNNSPVLLPISYRFVTECGTTILLSELVPERFKIDTSDTLQNTYPFLDWSFHHSAYSSFEALANQNLPPDFSLKTLFNEAQSYGFGLDESVLVCPCHGDFMSNNLFVADGNVGLDYAIIDFENYCDHAPILTDVVGLYLRAMESFSYSSHDKLKVFIENNLNLQQVHYKFKSKDVTFALIWLSSLGSNLAAQLLKLER